MHEEVMKFINHFTHNGEYKEVIDTFTHGCCYWFASILWDRFYDCDLNISYGVMMYDEVMNHFGCWIDGIVYDITGDVTNKYNWQPWGSFMEQDELLTERILRDCINF